MTPTSSSSDSRSPTADAPITASEAASTEDCPREVKDASGHELVRAPTGVPTPARLGARHLGYRVRFALRTSGLTALVGLGGWTGRTAIAWMCSKILGLFLSSSAREANRRRVQNDAIRRIVSLLGRLKGAFAKAGQFASTRHDLLPAGAVEALGTLRDRVPALPFDLVRDVVEKELGRPIDAAFASFDPVPIGAASIAQAHRATLPGGEQVVVKIQYPWIRDSLSSDLFVLAAAAHLWVWLRGRERWGVDRDRFFDEFKAGLREELDFVREGVVAGEIARNLAADPQIVVPAVLSELTRPRLLTMTWHPCVNVADRPGLANLGVAPRAVLEVLARAYAKQVFVDGHFHADPHPGNLFVVDEPGAAQHPRVLFVDFGLSKALDPSLRVAIRQGLYAVLQRDVEAFVARMGDMGMIAPGAEPGVRDAVQAMFERMATPGGTGGVLGASGAQVLALKDEAKRLLQETPGIQLPTELLLYAKTLSYLFALGEALDPEVDLMKIATPYLLQFLAARD
jgi:ubiquinone biosynthesis protein